MHGDFSEREGTESRDGLGAHEEKVHEKGRVMQEACYGQSVSVCLWAGRLHSFSNVSQERAMSFSLGNNEALFAPSPCGSREPGQSFPKNKVSRFGDKNAIRVVGDGENKGTYFFAADSGRRFETTR